MSSIQIAARAAFLLSIYSAPIYAQQDPACTDPDFSSYNATGSVTFDGFQPPELGINSTWTISTAVVGKSDPSTNTAVMLQTFWLDSTPFVDLSSIDMPLTGCVIALAESGSPASSDPTGGNTCSGVLASSCQQAIINQVNNVSLSNSGSGSSNNATCADYLSIVPDECSSSNDAWSILSVSDALGNPLSSSCPSSVSLGSGSPTTAPLILTSSAPYTPSSSNSTYDNWLKQATPIILTAWLKNGSGPESWADTRLVCVSAGTVEKGSKVAGAAGRVEIGWGIAIAIGVVGFGLMMG